MARRFDLSCAVFNAPHGFTFCGLEHNAAAGVGLGVLCGEAGDGD